MSNLLANGHTLLSGVLFDSDRKGIVYLDDIQLEPPTPGLFTLFDDHLHVQVNRWGNTQLSTTFSEPFAGQNAIKAEFPMAWEGFSLRQTQRVSTDEFGALTFAVKGNQSGQDLLVYAIDEDEDIVGTAVWASDYIYGGVLPTDWQVAWIPLRDLMPGGGDFNGIAVEPNVAGTVWLDEVKVVEHLEWPLPGVEVGKVSGYVFGSDWEVKNSKCNDLWKWHVGVDYSSNQVAGENVVAAHSGTVEIHPDSNLEKWGWHATIRSDGDAFTTSYTHLTRPHTFVNGEKVWLSSGMRVEKGAVIRETASIATGPHLDFAVRFGDYDLYKSIRGAYPRTPCGGLPAFPENFINPEDIKWQ
jgi:murein DD-endopeptidase MepM/ murein hydrolase activator NlpD